MRRSKPVTFNGVTYSSQRSAALALGVSAQAISQRVRKPSRDHGPGPHRSGATNQRRLDPSEVAAIETSLAAGESQQSVARRMNVSHSTVRRIARAERRGVLSHGESHHTAKLTVAAVREIRASSATMIELAELYSVTPVAISNVRRRKTWKDVE